jgi:hypothetical protein
MKESARKKDTMKFQVGSCTGENVVRRFRRCRDKRSELVVRSGYDPAQNTDPCNLV